MNGVALVAHRLRYDLLVSWRNPQSRFFTIVLPVIFLVLLTSLFGNRTLPAFVLGVYRAFLLYGELRYIYRLPKEQAPDRLNAWLAWASRSRLTPFVKIARTIPKHKAGVLAAIQLGLSNGRLEALNSKVRLISHRAYGFHSADALIAMIYLCCAGITIALPHR